MAIVKQSFISNIIGRDNYDGIKFLSKRIAVIGACIIAIIYLLSHYFHCGFISWLLDWVSGTSILFVAYIAALIVVLDIRVNVDEPEKDIWSMPKNNTKPITYKLTIVWSVMLIVLGISAIYFSDKYRDLYTFECTTFLVDRQAGIYHLDWNNHCDVKEEADFLYEMKGYQIGQSYILCEWCDDWASDAESEYESNKYIRR